MVYKVSWFTRILSILFGLLVLVLGYLSSQNTQWFIYCLVSCMIIALSLNIPLYLFRIELQNNSLILDWSFFKQTVSFYEIRFIGKVYFYNDCMQRKIFTYGIVCINEGKEKMYTFPKIGKLNEMIDYLQKTNQSILTE